MINVLFGDYIEACFPFLDRDPTLNFSAYLASAWSGAIAASAGARGSAYLPAPLAILLSNSPSALALASCIAFTVPFLTGVMSNAYRQKRMKDAKKTS